MKASFDRGAHAGVTAESGQPLHGDERPRRKGMSPILILSASLALMFALVAILDDGGVSQTFGAPTPPTLFAQRAECSLAPGDAAHHARELEQKALAENERAPFRSQDGVAAVSHLEEASACFAAAGEPERAALLDQLAQRWRRRLQADYQRARLQLELALRSAREQRAGDAGAEIDEHVATLRALLAHQDDPYLLWLERVQREHARAEEKP